MRTLLDSNILLRGSQPNSVHHFAANEAIRRLVTSGRALCVGSQSVYEFLAVATRPVADNGLAMVHADANAKLGELLVGIEVLFDSEAVMSELRRIVVAHSVTGKKVHDARLAATMSVHGIKEVLTFNAADFKRFAHCTVLDPTAVAGGDIPPTE